MINEISEGQSEQQKRQCNHGDKSNLYYAQSRDSAYRSQGQSSFTSCPSGASSNQSAEPSPMRNCPSESRHMWQGGGGPHTCDTPSKLGRVCQGDKVTTFRNQGIMQQQGKEQHQEWVYNL